MITGLSIAIILVFIIVALISKRETLNRLFSSNLSHSTQELQHELESTADHVIKQMEGHIQQLEYLISEADEKISELDNKLAHANQIIHDLCSLDNGANTGSEHVLTNHQNKQFDDFLLKEDISRPETPVEKSETQKTVIKEVISDDKKRLISAMAEQGYNVTEIAKATGIGKGAIMLMLQLYKK
jgi:transcriptional regulator with GAF, ATPase, and Fis domain